MKYPDPCVIHTPPIRPPQGGVYLIDELEEYCRGHLIDNHYGDYRRMARKGTLDQWVDDQVQATITEYESLKDSGVHNDTAWSRAMDLYLFGVGERD